MDLFKSTSTMLLTKDKEVQSSKKAEFEIGQEVIAKIVAYDFLTGGLIAQIGNERKALMSKEDLSIYDRKDTYGEIYSLIGTTVKCIITGQSYKNYYSISRRALMEKKLKHLYKDDIVYARVKSISDTALYLTFCDGLIGKMYTNQITSSKVERPADIYNVGDKIKCSIQKVQEDGKCLLSRISTYKNKTLDIKCGQVLRCRITQKVREGFGFFAEVLENPLYSGIFDITDVNCQTEYNVGEILDLRVIDIRNPKHLKFMTLSKKEVLH